MDVVRIDEKFAQFDERWRPKVIARLNGQEVKLVKIEGEFPWDSHTDADELFLCWRGRLRLDFRDRSVEVGPGEMIVAPRGVEHRPVSDLGAEILLFEPAEVRNPGDIEDPVFTAPIGVNI